jgi:hypothetical protein
MRCLARETGVFPDAQSAGRATGKLRRWRRHWIVERVDDAGHNLFSSGEAAIGGTPPAQREVVIVVSVSQATADRSSACDDERHTAIASRAERPDIAVRKTAPSGPQGWAAPREKSR